MNNQDILLRIGSIFHHKKFIFRNGEVGSKYLVLLSEPDPKTEFYLFAKTTSQQKEKSKEPGCQQESSAFFIYGGKEYFPGDTWVQLHELFKFEAVSILNDSFKKNLEHKGFLSDVTICQLKNCAKIVKDIEEENKELIIKSYYKRYPK